MPVQTVDEVIQALDSIVQQAYDESSRLGYFAALYRRVTQAVRDGINAGTFQNGPLLAKLDVTFALRYLDALATYQSGGKPTRSWEIALRAADDGSLLILQQLLAGMNAHINLDLAIAAAETCPGAEIAQLQTDFDQINAVLADEVASVEGELAAVSPLIGDLEKIGLRSETSIINFSIVAARQEAWLNAQRLAREPAMLHGVTIDVMDVAVSIKARAILDPIAEREGLQCIQQAEVHDVRRVIEVLSQANSNQEQAAKAF